MNGIILMGHCRDPLQRMMEEMNLKVIEKAILSSPFMAIILRSDKLAVQITHDQPTRMADIDQKDPMKIAIDWKSERECPIQIRTV